MSATALKFQLGARTLGSIRRELVRVSVDLDDALAERLPELPALPHDAHGYLVTSLAEARRADLTRTSGASIAHVRQRYVRYHADLTLGYDAYLATLSAGTRAQLRRKTRRVEAVSGPLRVDRFAAADDIERFHAVARRISARTYQERLLGGGLPGDAGFVGRMVAAAAADRVRAWLLTIAGEPAAYLYCEAQGDVLRYDHVGHDPAFGELSPGSVLMLAAFRDLMVERRFARFDFTEGEGQHKRQFATGGVACCDLLLLRRTVANRLTVAALGGFDWFAETAKALATHPSLKGLAQRVRRAS